MKAFFLLCIFSVSVFADVNSNASQLKPNTMPVEPKLQVLGEEVGSLKARSPTENVNELRFQVLEKKIDNMKVQALEKKLKEVEVQKIELVEILKWSVNQIIILIIVIFSINWFVGWRINKHEITKIQSNIKIELENSKLEIQQDIESKIDVLEKVSRESISSMKEEFHQLSSNIKSEAKDDSSRLVDNFQKQLDDFNANYRQQLTSINNSFESRIDSINDSFESQIDSIKDKSVRIETKIINESSRLDEKIKNENLAMNRGMTKAINRSKADLYRVAAYMWEANGVYRNAAMSFFDEVLIHLKLDNKTMVKMGLEQALGNLNQVRSLSKGDAAQIRSNLAKISDDFIALKTNISSKLDNIKLDA